MAAIALASFLALAEACVPNHAALSAADLKNAGTTLAAVAAHESGLNPFALNDNSVPPPRPPVRAPRPPVYQDANSAADAAEILLILGHSIDLGIMQINSKNLPNLGMSVRDAFDPCKSISGGYKVLFDAYRGGDTALAQQQSLWRALSVYNTGNGDAGFSNGYVTKVIAKARTLPAIDLTMLPSSTPSEAAASSRPLSSASAAIPQRAPKPTPRWLGNALESESGPSTTQSGAFNALSPN